MKRPNLATGLAANVRAAAEAPAVVPAEPAKAAKRVPAPANAAREGNRSPSRAGRKAVYAWVDPALHKQLKRVALETGRSIDALVTEGVELLVKQNPV